MQHLGTSNQHASPHSVSIRCPSCRQLGIFIGRPNVNDLSWQERLPSNTIEHRQAGVRVCPNNDCQAIVFVVKSNSLLETYPKQLIDFDASNLPLAIQRSLEEAILCHCAGAYRASALMVRRVLEELCEDRSAEGKDIFSRLQALKKTIVLPEELLQAAHELRILGNDAAHIEAKSHDEVSEPESALALELAKELLKAVYQYANLVARMRALKKQ